jgi:hypothetical protein
METAQNIADLEESPAIGTVFLLTFSIPGATNFGSGPWSCDHATRKMPLAKSKMSRGSRRDTLDNKIDICDGILIAFISLSLETFAKLCAALEFELELAARLT